MEEITTPNVPNTSDLPTPVSSPPPTPTTSVPKMTPNTSSKTPLFIGVAVALILAGAGAFYFFVYKPQQDLKNFVAVNDSKIQELVSQINVLAPNYPVFITTDLVVSTGTESAKLLGVGTTSAPLKTQKMVVVLPQVLADITKVTAMQQLKVRLEGLNKSSEDGLVTLKSVKDGLATWHGQPSKLTTVNSQLSKAEEYLKRSQVVSAFFASNVQVSIDLMPLVTNYVTILNQFVKATDKTVYVDGLNRATADLGSVTKEINAIDTSSVPTDLKEVLSASSQSYERMIGYLESATPLLVAGNYADANNFLVKFENEVASSGAIITNKETLYWQNEPILKTGSTVASNLTKAWEDFKSLVK